MMHIYKLVTGHRLLWKIILIFWITTLCTILANNYITKEISLSEFKSEHFKNKTRLLAQEAVKVYEEDGEKALRKWYRSTYRTDDLKIILLDKHLHNLGGHPTTKKKHKNDDDLVLHPKFFNDYLLSLSDQEIISDSGQKYIFRVLPSPALKAKFNPDTLHLYRFAASFIIIFIGSFWLYRSIAKPLSVLHDASKKLAGGDFSFRSVPLIGSRQDELGLLANAFDQMAIKIEALLTSQKQLFRDISHEIRTPLTRQKLAIELAKDSPTPSIYLDKIEHQNNNIDDLVNNLLTLMQLEDTELKHIELINLNELISNVINDAELDLQTKNIHVIANLEGQCLIEGNQILVTRAVENILMNSIKYSPESGEIKIHCFQQSETIKLVLSDQGPGIPENDIENILKPFYRSDQSRNQQTGGFGLGLSITNKIINQHHGTLNIQNIKPTGLELVIEIPASQSKTFS